MTKLFVFEGGEGSGKTTQINAVAEKLRDYDYSVIATRQPGGTGLGAKIRAILKDKAYFDTMPPLTRRLLFQADAIEHDAWMKTLKPDVILCDRICAISNEAYGVVEGCNLSEIAYVEKIGIEHNMIIEQMFILDVHAGLAWDRTDHEDLADQNFDQVKAVIEQYEGMAVRTEECGGVLTLGGTHIPASRIPGDRPVNVITEHLVDKILKHLQTS